MDLISTYTAMMAEKQTKAIEKTILDFLKKEGYELKDTSIESIRTLEAVLAAQGKRLRVEYFYKFNGDASITALCLPFFEALDCPIPRESIYRMLDLEKKGYRFYA